MVVLIAVLLVVTAWFLFGTKKSGSKEPLYKTALISRGDLASLITATGTLNPRQVVAVGTQVSGTVVRLLVDYNSIVKKGDLLAQLDTTFLVAALRDAEANLLRSDAQLSLSEASRKRVTELFEKGFASQTDLDQAVADHKIALASRTSIISQLERAKINLRYATVFSPIDGVVIARNVDVGQTVAASLSTPTLFKIAADLGLMQVLASVDEGDIGQVHKTQSATFTVDAYPEKTFTGSVSQIRLEPSTNQNVVSYTVLIDVPNPSHLLMPGMTANITIAINSVTDVLLVPSAALRFRPPFSKKERSGDKSAWSVKEKSIDHSLDNAQGSAKKKVPEVASTQTDTSRNPEFRRHRRGNSQNEVVAGPPSGSRGEFILPDAESQPIPGRIYKLVHDTLASARIMVLLNNGTMAAISGENLEGTSVVLSLTQPAKKKDSSQQKNPFAAPATPGGMGRGFR